MLTRLLFCCFPKTEQPKKLTTGPASDDPGLAPSVKTDATALKTLQRAKFPPPTPVLKPTPIPRNTAPKNPKAETPKFSLNQGFDWQLRKYPSNRHKTYAVTIWNFREGGHPKRYFVDSLKGTLHDPNGLILLKKETS